MMDEKQTVRVSKRLSRILRHDPGSVGITLDGAGWVRVDTLLAAAIANTASPVRSCAAIVVPHRKAGWTRFVGSGYWTGHQRVEFCHSSPLFSKTREQAAGLTVTPA